jgi:hypothetical protein
MIATMTTSDSASDFKNIEKAIRLLSAYESNLAVRAQDNPAFQAALQELVAFDDAVEIVAELGRVVQGLTVLSSIFLGVLAENTGQARSDLLGAYQRQTETNIRQLESE